MAIKIHVLNSSGKLDDYLDQIEIEIHKHLPKICELLHLEDVDICLTHDPKQCSPKTGLGGISYNPNTLMLFFDTENTDLRVNIPMLMGELLSHEMHHCAKIKQTGDSKNFRDYLVIEGLACLFESEFNGGVASSLFSDIKSTGWTHLYDTALPHFEDEKFDFDYWFLNTDKDGLPKYAGYWLGYNMAREYMSKNNLSHFEMLKIPSEDFEK